MKQYIVVGLGRFGSSVARSLAKSGHNVMVMDKDPDKVQSIANEVTHAVEGDATDEGILKTLGVRNFDVAIVSIGNDIHANILATMILKEQGIPYVIAKAQDTLHGNLLSKIGADRVVYPERDMGVRVAHNLMTSNVLDYIEFSPDYSIIEIVANPSLAGKSLKELKVRRKYNVNIIAIKSGENLKVSPAAEDVINLGDVLILMGKNEDLELIKSNL